MFPPMKVYFIAILFKCNFQTAYFAYISAKMAYTECSQKYDVTVVHACSRMTMTTCIRQK